MKEQSHKDEMSAALRGDFRRLRERGVAVALAPQEPQSEPAPSREPEEPEGVEPANDASPRDAEPEPVAGAELERRGWLSRLTGR